ncbi:GNAT family N-acetyltransferase [Nitrogeniibacter mangrovi]|uniref:GNAT family N-acetyltransferase n=1 Tax=Nitrogeniibacter mangrovi TaxID=2016596 RepID=A0A6C1B6F7_9RHOO|nr:GNAT family N-acetyltransferase [Nitrogeniibacter mangrovi]QID19316.1 GNAT family N-acetyltransferase [Nitrogeniibacter mangrovi]
MPNVRVRHTRPEDIPALIALQARVYPNIPPWSRRKLAEQLDVFPQGQIVAETGDGLIGCASALIVSWDEWAESHTWKEITGAGTFENHTPEGKTLYGAEVFVAPEARGLGIGHQLYEGRRTLCRAMNLKRIIACGRLPGYHEQAAEMTPEFYVQQVVCGDLHDPVLSFQLHEGFHYSGLVEDYLPEDTESCGYASIIVWLNPDYDPDRPTVIPETIL